MGIPWTARAFASNDGVTAGTYNDILTVSGDNELSITASASFTVDPGGLTYTSTISTALSSSSIAASGSATVSVKPNDGLAAGTYNYTLSIGFTDLGDDTYYFTSQGAMITGRWREIEGDWYYFDKNGKMARGTVIDGYEVGADGKRIDK